MRNSRPQHPIPSQALCARRSLPVWARVTTGALALLNATAGGCRDHAF